MDYWNIPYAAEADQELQPPDRPLTEPWTGKTIFNILRRPCAPGYEWIHGQIAKIVAKQNFMKMQQCAVKKLCNNLKSFHSKALQS